ncbi:hypothetical protein AVEN_134244-1, partial [Araneus ventricosus]
AETGLVYVKIHCPWEVLSRYGEILKFKMPMKESLFELPKRTSDNVPDFDFSKYYFRNLFNRMTGLDQSVSDLMHPECYKIRFKDCHFSTVYSRDKEYFKAEILASSLQQWNLLEGNVRLTSFRTRHLLFESFFKKEESLVFCCDIGGLLKELSIAHEPNEWRLFIDASKLSLKEVLLNNRKRLLSIPVAHAVYMKETYHNLKQLLEMINCNKYGWQICADLKVVSLLMGLQLG